MISVAVVVISCCGRWYMRCTAYDSGNSQRVPIFLAPSGLESRIRSYLLRRYDSTAVAGVRGVCVGVCTTLDANVRTVWVLKVMVKGAVYFRPDWYKYVCIWRTSHASSVNDVYCCTDSALPISLSVCLSGALPLR